MSLLVRTDVQAVHHQAVFSDNGEILALDLCTFCMINVYQRPRSVSLGGMQQEIDELVNSLRPHTPLVLMGDWNQPSDGTFMFGLLKRKVLPLQADGTGHAVWTMSKPYTTWTVQT